MMRRRDLEAALSDWLDREPFMPFIIEFNDGRRFVVEEKMSLLHYAGSAVYAWPDGFFDFVDPEDVRHVTELAPSGMK